MNVNEVLAALAGRALGRDVHPNDHVNASQSSNDTVPTAIRIAVARQLVDDVHPAVEALVAAFEEHGRALRPRRQVRADPPDGRHAGDARAGGRRVGGPARRRAAPGPSPTSRCSASCRSAGPRSAPASTRRPGSPRRVIAALAAETGLPLRPSGQPDGAAGRAGRAGRGVGRAARHRRRADQGRQRHPPARQRAVGRARRAAAARAAGRVVDHAGQGQPGAVRVGEPGGGAGVRQRRHRRVRRVAGHPRAEHVPAGDGRRPARVGDAARQRVPACSPSKCVAGIEADEARCRDYAERSSALATALNPIIGYAKAAELVHRAVDERRSIIDLVDRGRRASTPTRPAECSTPSASPAASVVRPVHRRRSVRRRSRADGGAARASSRPLAPKRNVAGVAQPGPMISSARSR